MTTTATVRYRPEGRTAGIRVVLAHGAGAGQQHPFLVAVAKALARRGIDVTTFDFPYVVAGRRLPDRPAVLEACARAVVEEVGAGGPVVFGGKSMGGRIGSQIAPSTSAVRALFFLGYPLHPPGKPDTLRVAHWPRITVPCLFVQGTRDPFGSPEELAPHLALLAGAVKVFPVEHGDHSFRIPKRSSGMDAGPSRRRRAEGSEVIARIHEEVARFVLAQGAR